jgi:hypothetical protein
MTNEKKNPWGRGPDAEREQPITDLTKNPFERHHDKTVKRNNVAAAAAADTKKIKDEAQKHFNASHQTTMTGTLMDQPLIKARDANQVARGNQGPAAPTPVTSWRSLQAMMEFWEDHSDNAVNFFRSEFNYTSLTNCLVTLVFGRQRPAIVETVAEAYHECVVGNHLELPRRVDGSGATIRRRGEPTPLPPTLYPAYVWPAQVEAASREELNRQVIEWLAEKKLAQKRPLAELQAEVRKNYKTARPEDRTWNGVAQ